MSGLSAKPDETLNPLGVGDLLAPVGARRPGIGHDCNMNGSKPEPDDPVARASNLFWYWLAVLIFLFMAVVVVMALIETHAK
jgi:hypothetical protein